MEPPSKAFSRSGSSSCSMKQNRPALTSRPDPSSQLALRFVVLNLIRLAIRVQTALKEEAAAAHAHQVTIPARPARQLLPQPTDVHLHAVVGVVGITEMARQRDAKLAEVDHAARLRRHHRQQPELARCERNALTAAVRRLFSTEINDE